MPSFATAVPALPAVRESARVDEHGTLVDGYRVYTRVAGPKAAPLPALVLVHGLLGTAAAWSPAMQGLAQDRRVYAFDAVGIGRSQRVAGLNAGLEASARRMARWMDAEGLDSVDLVSTSHGGAVSMYFAAMFPGRVRRLVLHAPANPFCTQSRPQIGFACTRVGRLVARLVPRAPRQLHRAAIERMYGDPGRVRPGSLSEYVTSLRVPGTVDYVLDVLGRWRGDMQVLAGMLGRLRRGRTLLLWGELDRAVSLASGRRLGRVLGAPVVVLPGLGHLPFEEDPDTFVASVRQFLAGEAAPRRTA